MRKLEAVKRALSVAYGFKGVPKTMSMPVDTWCDVWGIEGDLKKAFKRYVKSLEDQTELIPAGFKKFLKKKAKK